MSPSLLFLGRVSLFLGASPFVPCCRDSNPSGGALSGSEAAVGGGTGAANGRPGGPVDINVSVLERNKHPSRDGNYLQPLLTKAKVGAKMGGMALDAGFNATFTGSTWASPLYVDQGPGGKGAFFIVTNDNDVLAFDETDGHLVWPRPFNIGPAPQSAGPPGHCSPPYHVGILSTPVIDPKQGPDGFATIYVAGAIGNANGYIDRHEVHALSVNDGTERKGWPINVSAIQAAASTAAGITNFHADASNQRSALSLVNGLLYVAYGGHVGDCDTYHGWVVAIDVANPSKTGAWATAGQGEAIWAAGGMVSDGDGVIAVTSNSTTGITSHADSEEVVRVTGMASVNRSNANIFYPGDWRDHLDAKDLDFGSSSPVLFSVPGAVPANLLAAVTKAGTFYLLDPANLGGIDGYTAKLTIADDGPQIRTTLAAYTSASGAHVILEATAAHCPGGTSQAIVSISVPPGAPPVPAVAWCAPTQDNGAPIATTSDGKNDAIVWFINHGNLIGVDGDTGMPIVTGAGQCGVVREWISPIAVKGRIVVSANGKLCSWSVH
jgi:hypothetical protein